MPPGPEETRERTERHRGVPLWGLGLGAPAFALLAVLRHYGDISHAPLAVVFGEFLVTLVGTAVFSNAFPPGTARAKPRLFLLLQIALIAAIVYTLGWGSILAVGFIVPAANLMSSDGSRLGRWAMADIVAVVAAGETAVGLGWAPSLVPEPLGHALALLEICGAGAVIWIMTFNQRGKEAAEQEVVDSGERFRALVQHAPDLIIVVSSDGHVTYASPSVETVLGYPADEVVGTLAQDLLTAEDLSAILARGDMADLHVAPFRGELRIRHRDGTWRWCDVTLTNLSGVAGVDGWVANLRDVTEQKEAAEALREAHEQFRTAFENAPIGMGMTDLDGTIIQTNSAYCRILGRPAAELVGRSIFDFTHSDDRDSSRRAMEEFVASGAENYQTEKRYVDAADRDVWVSLRVSCVRGDGGEPLYLIGQAEDITERRELRERLAHAAVHDSLTGLPNRVLFTDRLESAMRRARRGGGRVAVMFLDLDHFKLVNDTLGHAAGDRLLRLVAGELAGVLRESDTLARFGGDEFTVLCEVHDREEALEVARRLVGAMQGPVSIDNGDYFVSVCVGLAFAETGQESGADLLRNADAAMYIAKERGPGEIHVYETDAEFENVYRLRTVTELHRALERDELELHYQPIVDLHTETLVGLEALVRWNHPTRGLLMPDEFVPVAETSGLIVRLGRWVIEEACRQAMSWELRQREAGVPTGRINVSVNVSARQLAAGDFYEVVAGALDMSGLDPDQLWLEITESTVMRHSESTAALLQAVRDLGVHLEIDDFGTGYSSLSYLKQLPVEALKVDRSFVGDIDSDADDVAIARSVIALGESLGLSVIAEGVERQSQTDVLRQLGCYLAQGYLYGRAVPPSALYPFPGADLAAWRLLTSASA